MKYNLYFILAAILTLGCANSTKKEQQATTTTFILVRHAEKANDVTKDPPLTEEGTQRAERLAALLDQQDIVALYATPYQRTQLTLQPLATAKNLSVTSYQPGEEGFLTGLLESQPNNIIVIAGHSNTIPALVNELIGEEKFVQLDESDYNDIFVVTCSEIGKGNVIQLTY